MNGVPRIESAHDTNDEPLASASENAVEQTLPKEEKSPDTSSEEPTVSSVSVPAELERSHLEERCYLCNRVVGVELQEGTVQTTCRFCRRGRPNNHSGRSISEFDKDPATAVDTESDSRDNLRSTYADDRLLGLPDSTSLAECGSERQVEDLETEVPPKENTPSLSKCLLEV